MLKCNDCGARFEYPKAVQEYRGEYWGFPAYETVGYCPKCGGWDFGEEEELKEWWISATAMDGSLFGDTIEAVDDDDLFDKFNEKYPDCEIADYGCYGEEG